MTWPVLLLDILTGLMLAVAVVSLARIAPALSPADRLSTVGTNGSWRMPRGLAALDVDFAHLLMCAAMAKMSTLGIETFSPRVWETIFAILLAWFAWRLVDGLKLSGLRSLLDGHSVTHLVHCAAMVFMCIGPVAPDHMDMMGMGMGAARPHGIPALALAFALACCSAWDLFGQLWGWGYRLRVRPCACSVSDGRTASTAACRTAMGAVMTVMLLTMN